MAAAESRCLRFSPLESYAAVYCRVSHYAAEYASPEEYRRPRRRTPFRRRLRVITGCFCASLRHNTPRHAKTNGIALPIFHLRFAASTSSRDYRYFITVAADFSRTLRRQHAARAAASPMFSPVPRV